MERLDADLQSGKKSFALSLLRSKAKNNFFLRIFWNFGLFRTGISWLDLSDVQTTNRLLKRSRTRFSKILYVAFYASTNMLTTSPISGRKKLDSVILRFLSPPSASLQLESENPSISFYLGIENTISLSGEIKDSQNIDFGLWPYWKAFSPALS